MTDTQTQPRPPAAGQAPAAGPPAPPGQPPAAPPETPRADPWAVAGTVITVAAVGLCVIILVDIATKGRLLGPLFARFAGAPREDAEAPPDASG